MGKKKEKGSVVKFGLAGFARINIMENGKLVGDSGWNHNVVTDFGIDEGLAQRILGGSVYGAYAALGTGGDTATNTSNLPNVILHTQNRDSCSTSAVTNASAAAVTARWYGTIVSSDYFTASTTIGNIGIFNSASTNAGSILCGATYTSSGINTNQDVNYTYEWQFATTT